MRHALLIAIEAMAAVAALDFLVSFFRNATTQKNRWRRLGTIFAVGLGVFVVTFFSRSL
jgi:hypothetical protein